MYVVFMVRRRMGNNLEVNHECDKGSDLVILKRFWWSKGSRELVKYDL